MDGNVLVKVRNENKPDILFQKSIPLPTQAGKLTSKNNESLKKVYASADKYTRM